MFQDFCPLVSICVWSNGKSENDKKVRLGYLSPIRTLPPGDTGLAAFLLKIYSSCQVALTIKPPPLGSNNHPFSLLHHWIGESSPLSQAQNSTLFLLDFLKPCPHICILSFNFAFLKMTKLSILSVSCQDSK